MVTEAARRRLGATGLDVPALGVGTKRWGRRAASQEALTEICRAALAAGIALFDTAEVRMAGRSEGTSEGAGAVHLAPTDDGFAAIDQASATRSRR
ncbi:MAG TPA: hypothetical protein VE990_14120 [Acidimicrobiales bacterium]|nr:hypothetical protein [Acidimicrobiales bacterium]